MNGDEDGMIRREAGGFWQEMHMRTAVNAAVANVKQRHEAKLIP